MPVFAPPAIRNSSTNFVLYQTPTILRYLGKKFGMFPETEEMAAHADALMSFLTDFIAEGRLVFHPVCFTMSYYQQIEEAKPHIRWFETQRLPRFLAHLNATLLHNQSASRLVVLRRQLSHVRPAHVVRPQNQRVLVHALS